MTPGPLRNTSAYRVGKGFRYVERSVGSSSYHAEGKACEISYETYTLIDLGVASYMPVWQQQEELPRIAVVKGVRTRRIV